MKTFVLVFTLLGTLLVSANHKDPVYWRMVRKGVEAKIVLTVWTILDLRCLMLPFTQSSQERTTWILLTARLMPEENVRFSI